MLMKNKKIVFATNSAKHFHLDNGALNIGRFPDGEISVILEENVKDKEVILIGSTESPADKLLELILSIDAVLQKGAKKITVLIPYFGYARSDNKDNQDKISSAKTIVKIFEDVGDKKCSFIILDPHSENLKNYFHSPYIKRGLIHELAKRFNGNEDATVVAPDRGSKESAVEFAQETHSKNIVVVEKKRLRNSEVKIVSISGNTTPKAIIVDDMVSSGNTILETAKMLKANGAQEIYVAVIHMIYTADGWQKLAESPLIKRVLMTDTIAPPEKLPSKFEIVPIAPILEKIINPPSQSI
jgi:ribose-phosphate pyrophosphokinase